MEGWLAFSKQFLSPLSQYRSSMMGNVYAFYSENFGDILDPTPLYVIDPDCYLDLGPNLWQLCGSHFRATCSTMLIYCTLLYCGGGGLELCASVIFGLRCPKCWYISEIIKTVCIWWQSIVIFLLHDFSLILLLLNTSLLHEACDFEGYE